MRGNARHVPNTATQPCPPDNTSEHVMYQVRVFTDGVPDGRLPPGMNSRYGIDGGPIYIRPLIHPESAMEIAAWWQAPGNAFAVFASHGEITPDLADEIEAEIAHAQNQPQDAAMANGTGWRDDNIAALRALLAYLKACEVT